MILDDTLPGHKGDYHMVVISYLKTLWRSVHCVFVPINVLCLVTITFDNSILN